MLRSKDLNILNVIAESFVLLKLLISHWLNKVPVSDRLPDLVDSQALAQSQSYIHLAALTSPSPLFLIISLN